MPIPPVAQWSFIQWIIAVIVVAACIGIMFVVLNVFGISIPPFVVTIAWICLAAVVGIVAIKFVASLMSGPPAPPVP